MAVRAEEKAGEQSIVTLPSVPNPEIPWMEQPAAARDARVADRPLEYFRMFSRRGDVKTREISFADVLTTDPTRRDRQSRTRA